MIAWKKYHNSDSSRWYWTQNLPNIQQWFKHLDREDWSPAFVRSLLWISSNNFNTRTTRWIEEGKGSESSFPYILELKQLNLQVSNGNTEQKQKWSRPVKKRAYLTVENASYHNCMTVNCMTVPANNHGQCGTFYQHREIIRLYIYIYIYIYIYTHTHTHTHTQIKVKVIPQQAEVAQGVPGRLRPWW